MPITIYPAVLKYKNSQGAFQATPAIKGDSGEATMVTVEGTSPTIICEANHYYVCGEVSSLNITPSANGICDITFISGATPTVLTIPNTIQWPADFDPSSLQANTTYEINLLNGLGVVGQWT